jgi:hypothetical protein
MGRLGERGKCWLSKAMQSRHTLSPGRATLSVPLFKGKASRAFSS